MNITLGVPRIKEIINASKKINTPIITAPLECDTDVKTARIVKGRIETTRLGEIAKSIEAVFSASSCKLRVVLDLDTILDLQLNIHIRKVSDALQLAKKLKLKGRVYVMNESTLEIEAPELQLNVSRGAATSSSAASVLQAFHALKQEVSEVIIEGIHTVSRAVINDDGSGKYHLLVEGYDLAAVMSTLGVRGRETTSNHIIEVWKVLGIEAARTSIMHEINTTMESHGLYVDPRHMALLADIMTYRGEVLGITRFGIAKMKESVLMLASFEKTADHLFEAALRGTTDNISGVSECIIMGEPMPVGTGLFGLLQKAQKVTTPSMEEFDQTQQALRKKGKARDVAAVMHALQNKEELDESKKKATMSLSELDAIMNDEPVKEEVNIKEEAPRRGARGRKAAAAAPPAPVVAPIVEKRKPKKDKPAQTPYDPFAHRAPLMSAFARMAL
jgi:DNA-directed RNA polymerase III subunit RPC1